MINIFKVFLGSLYRYLTNSYYRQFAVFYQRYGSASRRVLSGKKVLGQSMDIPDAQSFVWQFKELFVDEIYRFESEKSDPFIIDCGANIGLSCIYFKRLFPKARIMAFEADPQIAGFLNKNLHNGGWNDVAVINKAVWVHNDGIRFTQDGSDGGSIGNESENTIHVPTQRLKDVLASYDHIDFLKMDIEGAEIPVLLDCRQELSKIDKLFVEYHSISGQPQDLDKLMAVLSENGFRYHIQSLTNKKHPFVKSKAERMDLQLNVFAVRE